MVTIDRLMAQGVVVARPEHTVDYVKRQMKTLDIHAVPVADGTGIPIGIVRARDLLEAIDPTTPVEEIMCRDPVTVDLREQVQKVAVLMRRRRQRQAVVTEYGKIVGIVSAYDFLELLEGYRFEAKASPEFQTGIIDIGRGGTSGD